MHKLKLTSDGVQKLEKEIDGLHVRQVALIEKIKEAASEGFDNEDIDLSLDYSELSRIENRIAELEYTVSKAEIIEKGSAEHLHSISLGHLVRLAGKGGEQMYQLVESIEADPSSGRISVDSPLGQSLLGKKVQDTISIDARAGSHEYQIVGIE